MYDNTYIEDTTLYLKVPSRYEFYEPQIGHHMEYMEPYPIPRLQHIDDLDHADNMSHNLLVNDKNETLADMEWLFDHLVVHMSGQSHIEIHVRLNSGRRQYNLLMVPYGIMISKMPIQNQLYFFTNKQHIYMIKSFYKETY